MAKFAIPKKVTFEELGEEFKDSYLVFRSVPTSDFESLTKLLDKSKETPEVPLPALIEVLEKYFIKGSFYDLESEKNVDVTKEDIPAFDSDVIVTCFQTITGTIDPKKKMNSIAESSTANQT